MEKYTTAGSNDTPLINLDPDSGQLYLGGSSLPENVYDTYNPITAWMDKYIEAPQDETIVDFSFEYVNTASSHMIMQLLQKMVKLQYRGKTLIINWYYNEGDIDIRDFGEELSELTGLSMNIMVNSE